MPGFKTYQASSTACRCLAIGQYPLGWEIYFHQSAFAWLAFDLKPRPIGFDHGLGQRQSQTGSVGVGFSINLLKGLQRFRQFNFTHADTGIANPQNDFAAFFVNRGDDHLAPRFWCI